MVEEYDPDKPLCHISNLSVTLSHQYKEVSLRYDCVYFEDGPGEDGICYSMKDQWFIKLAEVEAEFSEEAFALMLKAAKEDPNSLGFDPSADRRLASVITKFLGIPEEEWEA